MAPFDRLRTARQVSADPELAAVTRERLRRILAERLDGGGARRAAAPPHEDVGSGSPSASALRGDQGSGLVGVVGLEDLEPVRRFTRWHLAVVAVVLLVGVVWGGWSLLRNRPVAIAAPAAVETSSTPDAGGSGASSSSGPSPGPASAGGSTSPGAGPSGAALVVHVLGAVRTPGLVHLAAGARVEDAVEAAGGMDRDADPDQLNLAQPLSDGEQVLIGTKAHPAGEVRAEGGSASGGMGSTSGSTSGRGSGTGTGVGAGMVDLNRATSDQLEALPGVGPVTAQKILAWRQQHGRFSKPDELQEVDGIGPKTYAQIAPHVRV